MRGRVFDIQRFSLHDGPGIRTTVFLQGCPLRCAWCHNPEGIAAEPLLSFVPDRCIGCGRCLELCPQGAHRLGGSGHVLDRERCVLCGACAEECWGGALQMVGREVTVAEVLGQVLRDRPFYGTSAGGMTLSGGEPTHQVEFTASLLKAAGEEELHCCVETCGFAPYERLERLRPDVDLWLFDWKESDPERHRELTGSSNRTIRSNLRRLHQAGAGIRLRCPIIPGVNDREEHFGGIAELARALPGIQGVELIAYHALGEGKLRRFGLGEAGRIVAEPPDRETVRRWEERLGESGVRVIGRSRERRTPVR
jgi:pyruvate formate lyase activating enzyme